VTHERKMFYLCNESKSARREEPLGRPRRRWEDNIKMDQGDRYRWDDLDLADSRYGPVAGFCEHGSVPSGSMKKVGYCLTG
jgi:hypothetical protein